MKRNFSNLLLSVLTSTTAALSILSSIPSLAHAANSQSERLTNNNDARVLWAANAVTTPLDSSYMKSVSQGFGGWNSSFGGYHTGYDIATANRNPSVYAIADGTVVWNSTSSSKYTNAFDKYWNAFVIIKHGNYYAYYGHLTSSLKENSQVRKGSSIGSVRDAYSSSTKKNTGNNHLHISISTGKDWVKSGWGYQSQKGLDQFVNPAQYIGL